MDASVLLVIVLVAVIAFSLGLSVARSRHKEIRRDAVERSKSVIL